MRVFAITGSLRTHSTNTALLAALALVAPRGVEVVVFKDLGQIPPFNPDLEGVSADEGSVAALRRELRAADVVVFSTPEYAHGMPGVLKNALDWMVKTGELSGKAVALLNASARGVYAQASLREVLRTMDARVLEDAELTVELERRASSAREIAGRPAVRASLLAFLGVLTTSRR